MLSQPDLCLPARMAAEVGALCARARQDAEFIYGQLLRENVADVLHCSFPGFSAEIGSEQLEAYASAFVAGHPAQQPQFYHIATEFVRFAQQTLTLPQPLLDLLEYEWVLLAVEIDPAKVGTQARVEDEIADQALLALNRTVRLLVLPLRLIEKRAPTGTPDGPHRACAVYRTGRHNVVTRVLSFRDCLLIDHIRGAGRLTLAALIAGVSSQLSAIEVRRWTAENAASHLLIAAAISEGYTHEIA